VGADNQGVAGARVWIDSLPARTVTSARDGTFEIDHLVARTYDVRAGAGDLVGGPQAIRLAEHSAPVVIHLREGAHVEVSVVDATRVPIANASVRVIGSDVATTTDATGKATIATHPEWIAIEATGRGYAPRRVSVTTAAGFTSRVTIVLREGFEVRGRIVDQAGKPIPNARIYACQESAELPPFNDDEPPTAVSDQRGAFVVPSAVGMHTFLAIDGEHAPKITPMFDIDRAITDLEIVMKPGGVYAGEVVDAHGKPVAQARVYLDMVSGPQHRFTASSDANGAFEIRGLPRTLGQRDADTYPALAYAIADESVSDVVPVAFAKRPELRGQRLALTRSDTTDVIAGVVVDDTGAPVANVLVNAVASLPLAITRSRPDLVDRATATSTTTNARGEFSLADLPAGEYGVWPGGYDRRSFPASLGSSAVGENPSLFMTSAKAGDKAVRIVMPRPARIIGKVAFADTGEPVDDFTTYTYTAGPSAVPGEHGVLDLRDLKPGSYGLIINGPGFLWTKHKGVRVDAGKTIDVGVIRVERGRTLRGKVVDAAGRGIAGASVRAGENVVYESVGRFDEPTFDRAEAITDANGAFTIVGGVPLASAAPFTFAVGADHSSYGRALPVVIPQGKEDPPAVTLTLLECGSIAGKVTRNGQPLLGATIDAGSPAFGRASSNDDGEFVLPRLPAGPVTLSIHVSSDAGDVWELMRSHQRAAQVEAGRQTEVTLDIPIGTIKLSVVLKPLPGAAVLGARLYLFRGTLAVDDYAQLSSRLAEIQGRAEWAGDAGHPAAFERLLPGDYTVCTIPLAWSPNDHKQMQRLQSDRASMKVYCTPAHVAPAPAQQTLTVQVPSMAPLP
jgi:uncharacterized GH25 family protein